MQYVMQTITWFLKSTLSLLKIFQFFTEMIQKNIFFLIKIQKMEMGK